MGKALLFVLVLAAPAARGCSITVTFPLKYEFKKAPAVFEGTLLRIDDKGMHYFRVEQRWKGPPAETYAIYNPPTSSCSYTGLIVGERYVVVPDREWKIESGSWVAAPDSETRRLIDRRARWWSSPLSSFTLYAMLQKIGQ
jgi:hypothetical protein